MDLLLEGSDRVREFDKQMVENLSLHASSAIISKAFRSAAAVCRIDKRGSGVLVCRRARTSKPRGHQVAPEIGVLLTTAYCLPNAETAEGLEAVFDLPNPGRGSRDWGRVRCRLLPEYFYYSSVGPCDAVSAFTIGYVLVACELVGVGAKYSVAAAPLPLPLVQQDHGRLDEGDTCLIIQHPNGTDGRKYHLTTCACVEKNHYIHETASAPSYDSSGGAVFNEAGDFVGLGHMAQGVHITVSIHGILRHAIHHKQLRAMNMGMTTEDPALMDKFADGDPEEDDHAGYSLSARPGVYWKNVWDTWYEPTKYGTIVLMLYAFPYHKQMVLTALSELTSHNQRLNVGSIASYEGIEAIMDVLECNMGDKDVVYQAVSALGMASGYSDNLESIHRANALPLVVEAMRRYGDHKGVAQWGSLVLLNLFTEQDEAELAKGSFMALDGVGVLKDALGHHMDDPYAPRWGFSALAAVGAFNEEFLEQVFDTGAHCLLLAFLDGGGEAVLEDVKTVEALLAALAALLDDATLPCAETGAGELFGRNVLPVVSALLHHWAEKRRTSSPEALLHHAAVVVHRIITAHPPALPSAISLNLENALFVATTACPSSTRVLKAAVEASRAMGVPVEERYEHRNAVI
eukprot:TRINITY_DN28289_c0_g1_i1.p1 TRINITY_DN28289_c0_g1~~TRINITY_DN28289_c0_g1_i1.p1  ORF type:complete len:651 (+),score=219.79 TRINITY_DN28289_c0_g1_i1:62-1954(+)